LGDYLCGRMRIFTEQRLREYCEEHPESRVAVQYWVFRVKHAEWKCFADVRRTFATADCVGNQRIVFDIKGNDFRLVAVVRYTIGYVYVRFIGTHDEYDKIKDIREI